MLYAAELPGLLSLGVGKSAVSSGRFYELPYWVEGQKTGRTYDDA
jgi:hypothetical protein